MPQRNPKRRRGHRWAGRNNDKHTTRWWLFVFFAAGDSHTMPRESSRLTNLDLNIFFIVMFHNSKCRFRKSSQVRWDYTDCGATRSRRTSLTWRDISTVKQFKVNLHVVEPSLHRSSHCLSARGLSAKKHLRGVLFPLSRWYLITVAMDTNRSSEAGRRKIKKRSEF